MEYPYSNDIVDACLTWATRLKEFGFSWVWFVLSSEIDVFL